VPAVFGPRGELRYTARRRAAIPGRRGGTLRGETLRGFLDEWGRRGTARGAVVVIHHPAHRVGWCDLRGAAPVTRRSRPAWRRRCRTWTLLWRDTAWPRWSGRPRW
jgi:hypothetical protein